MLLDSRGGVYITLTMLKVRPGVFLMVEAPKTSISSAFILTVNYDRGSYPSACVSQPDILPEIKAALATNANDLVLRGVQRRVRFTSLDRHIHR